MATAKVFLISEAYLKENTSINLNVEDNLFDNSIIDAQTIHLQPILGTALYLKILTDVAAGTITGAYKTLLDDYCQKVVAYGSLFEALPFIRYKIMQKGVVQQTSNFSIQPEVLEFQYLTDTVKNKMEFYIQRLADYLKTQTSSVFPELNQNKDFDDMLPESSGYDCSIYLGGNETNCERYLGLNKNVIYLG